MPTTDTKHATLKDYLKLHFIVGLLGFTAILGRLIEASPLAVVVYRTLLTTLGLGIILVWKRQPVKLPTPAMWQLIGTGVLIGIHWICFFGSARMATVSISLVCVSTTSFFTSFVEPLLNQRPIRRLEVFLGILVVIGIGILFQVEFQYVEGILVGLFGALLGSFFSVLNGRHAARYDARLINFYEMIGAFIVGIAAMIFVTFFDAGTSYQLFPTLKDWAWLLILSLVCTVYAYVEMVNLLKKISAFTLNLSINLEPIYGIIMAYLIFGEKERMTPGFYIGGALILATVLLHPILSRRGK